ncbi:hypothetical protein CDAR_54061 [Caerostris darwini]|uniref:Uncharacterized protein n=1 Tax=Caerostris darwini TaxID=1538125 RepID=A0AAV4WED9_9ARAC|nr:hypothetical protein CDAR_54061 [Caerostris darwini]
MISGYHSNNGFLDIFVTFRSLFRHVTSQATRGKFRSVLFELNCVSDSLRTVTVAMFRILTGYGCLYFRFNLTTSPNFVLLEDLDCIDGKYGGLVCIPSQNLAVVSNAEESRLQPSYEQL